MNDVNKRDTFPLKMMQINFHRAGTTSTARALNMLDVGPTWHTALNDEVLSHRTIIKAFTFWVENEMDLKIINDEEGARALFNEWLHIHGCPVIMDAPVSMHWRRILEWYPECKVILCVRDFEAWHRSITANINGIFFSRWFRFFARFLPINGWLLWYLQQTVAEYKSDGQIEECRQTIAEYVENVRRTVPAGQLLVYDVKEGWTPLLAFCGAQTSQELGPFPYHTVCFQEAEQGKL